MSINAEYALFNAILKRLKSLAASWVTSGRFPMSRMPDMALNKVMVGQGVGSSPVEQDKPAAVPSGMIAMWHGTIATIPDGWVICDGNSGTPNLLTRFVEGVATATTNPGATGGAKNKTTAGHEHVVNRDAKTGDAGVQIYSVKTPTASKTDSISDIRPPYYDVAFIMKS